MAGATKERIVERSAELFRRQGFAGTGVKQIVAEASAPFGSLYHFFPGGKEQLGEEVIRWSGAIYGQLIDAFFVPGADPVAATRAWARASQASGSTGICVLRRQFAGDPIEVRPPGAADPRVRPAQLDAGEQRRIDPERRRRRRAQRPC